MNFSVFVNSLISFAAIKGIKLIGEENRRPSHKPYGVLISSFFDHYLDAF